MAEYYVDGAVGNDGNLGTSEGAGNAWATIDKAMNTVVAADIVYVKASAVYNESPAIDTAGTTADAIRFEGYTTTPGDGGRASITGGIIDTLGSTLGNYIFKNFDIENSGGDGVNISVTHMTWKNCKFHDCSSSGFETIGGLDAFEGCEFVDNTSHGYYHESGGNLYTSFFVGCKFYSNGADGIMAVWGGFTAIFCEFFANAHEHVEVAGGNNQIAALINCTLDGDARTTRHGADLFGVYSGIPIIVNCVVYDCQDGMEHYKSNERAISRNNLFNSNAANYVGDADTYTGEQTGAPVFTDEANNDYTPATGSPMLGNGYDLGSGGMDIGAIQVSGGAGAGATGSRRQRTRSHGV
jgi:hypothetical protein